MTVKMKIPKTTKSTITDKVFEVVGWASHNEAVAAVEAALDIMKETLARGENVEIVRFGKFVLHDKRARVGRNPQTGAPIPIEARRVLTFQPSDALRKILNVDEVEGEEEA